MYVVGKDMTGHLATSGGGQCYYATLKSSTNTSDVNNIVDDNFNGRRWRT